MRVAVTGATGHLGRYVTHRLADLGYEVLAFSRSGGTPARTSARASSPGRIEPIGLDVTSEEAVKILRTHLPAATALVHLAARHAREDGEVDRVALLETNVLGTMRVLEAARRAMPSAIVFASCLEVYGRRPLDGALTEESPTVPDTDYGATKLAGEEHLCAASQESGARTVSLRFSEIYGPGGAHDGTVRSLLRWATHGAPGVGLGARSELRDQVHARDAAEAVALALESSASGVFNVSDGDAHSIAWLARAAAHAADVTAEPELRSSPGLRWDHHVSIERARRVLGFSPRVSLREGMQEELHWMRTRADGRD